MSTTPRVSSAIPGQPANFGTGLAHQPVLAARFSELYGTFWSKGILEHRTKEVARMRNARITDCGFCKRVRFSAAREEGLTEDLVAMIENDWESSALTERDKAALTVADAIIGDPRRLPEEARARIRREFSEAEVVELALGVSLFLGLAKVLITLGMEPEQMETTIVPTPGSQVAVAA